MRALFQIRLGKLLEIDRNNLNLIYIAGVGIKKSLPKIQQLLHSCAKTIPYKYDKTMVNCFVNGNFGKKYNLFINFKQGQITALTFNIAIVIHVSVVRVVFVFIPLFDYVDGS